jgi:hypothetical protein
MTASMSPSLDWDGIYHRRIRTDLLGGINSSEAPTAVIVRGQPGAGTMYAFERVRMNLATSGEPAALISRRVVAAYHPTHMLLANSRAPGSETASTVVDRWVTRLISDAASQGLNIVLESGLSTGDEERFTSIAAKFKNGGYQVATVNLATDRDQSRQTMLASHDMAQHFGLPTNALSVSIHDAAYEELGQSLELMEVNRLVDRIQIVTSDGRQLYANQLQAGQWQREARAVDVLDDFRERRLTARELADSALRWDILVRRITDDASAPVDLKSQAANWREEALARVQADADATKLLAWGREAQHFVSMNRYDFQRQFPQHAGSVHRLQEAVSFAETNFADASDRHRFIEQTRRRLAERIAEGRADAPARAVKDKGREPKTR